MLLTLVKKNLVPQTIEIDNEELSGTGDFCMCIEKHDKWLSRKLSAFACQSLSCKSIPTFMDAFRLCFPKPGHLYLFFGALVETLFKLDQFHLRLIIKQK